MEASWRLLEASWRHLGGVLEALEGVLEALGGILEVLAGVRPFHPGAQGRQGGPWASRCHTIGAASGRYVKVSLEVPSGVRPAVLCRKKCSNFVTKLGILYIALDP